VIDELRPLSNHKYVKSGILLEEILDADESSFILNKIIQICENLHLILKVKAKFFHLMNMDPIKK